MTSTVASRLQHLAAGTARRDRERTRREEAANAISHGMVSGMAAAALPVLAGSARSRRTGLDVVGAALFGTTMVLPHFVSVLYHALPAGGWKARPGKADHVAIYLFIAAIRQRDELRPVGRALPLTNGRYG